MKKKIFISHAAVDKTLVNAFVRFLKIGLEIRNDEIFCTSLSGTPTTGHNFINQIKDNIIDCEKVIFLITENYFKSPFCMSEMGAAWAINQNIYPIIVPPITFSDINRTPLLGVQAKSIIDNNTLSVMADEFMNDGIIINVNTSLVIAEAKEFGLALKKYMRLLKEDTSGFVTANILAYKKLYDSSRREYHGYTIKEQIDIGQDYNEQETHILVHRAHSDLHLVVNEKVKFKPSELVEDTNHDISGERIFVVSRLLAVDVEL